MSVKHILKLAGDKIGLDPTYDDQRVQLVRFLNEAAQELYNQADMTGSLMEQVFKVNGDQTISLPNYVGPIRGMREFASMMAWHLNRMRPRYNQFNWKDMWRNYRELGKRTLQQSVTNQSKGVIVVPSVEDPPIVVTVSGTTPQATLVSEDLTISAVQVQTANVFLDYSVVKKDRQNAYDVVLQDVDGKLLTTIPNNELVSEYQIVDVSACPWMPQNTSVFDNWMEILYKRKLPYLENDDDEFPAFDCDYIVVNKMCQLWAEEQGKVDIATAFDAKASRSLGRLQENQGRANEDEVSLVQHPHDTMLKRIGTGLRRRYNLYAGRKF